MEKINGFEMKDSNGCNLEVLVENSRITVEYNSDHGRKVIFNEAVEKFATIADLTNELHDQNLEDLESAIWDTFGERIVRKFAGWELWLKGDDYAAICEVGEKPDFDEYSVPYLVTEWNRKTGDTLEEDFFQGI